MKAIVTIKAANADSEECLKEWLAGTHGTQTPLADALRDEISSWLQADSGAELIVDVEVAENAGR
jgi:hypothetical protein